MSELPRAKPSDLDKMNWGDGATPHTQNAPGTSLRGSGFPTGSEVAYDHENWRRHKLQEFIEWLDNPIRTFESSNDLINGLTTKDIGKISKDLGLLGDESASIQTQTTDDLQTWCSDGYQVYAIVDGYVMAWDPSDMSTTIWTQNLSATLDAICTDGNHVFVAEGHAGSTNVYKLACKDGTLSSPLELSASDLGVCGGLCSDGVNFYAAFGSNVYHEGIDDWTTVSNFGAGNTVLDLHTSCGRLYVSTADHVVKIFDIVTSITLNFSTTDNGNTTATMKIAADSKRIYILSTVQDAAGEILDYLTAISAFDGHTLWSTDEVGSATGDPFITHDEKYLYISNDWEVYWVDKVDGKIVWNVNTRTHPLATPDKIIHMIESGNATTDDCRTVDTYKPNPIYLKIDSKDNCRPIQGWVLAPTTFF